MAFIFVELIATIKIVATVNERGMFIAEPFLLVGLIAVVRSVLLLIATPFVARPGGVFNWREPG